MILPPDLAAALGQLPFAGLARRPASYGHAVAEIHRLTAPSMAGGIAATGACVEPVAAEPFVQHREPQRQPRRQPQLVPIEELIRDDGVCQLYGIIGWAYR